MEAQFHATVSTAGKVVWSNPIAAADFFKAIAGRRVTIVVEEPDRTKEMNRLLHMLFRSLSKRTGHTPAWHKAHLKVLFMSDPERGTSGMSVDEAAEFAEFCFYWAAEVLNVVL